MRTTSTYFKFIREKGIEFTDSNDIALTVDDALHALDLLYNDQIAILGGDILSKDRNGELIYAYQLWDPGYHYLNWCCNINEGEKQQDYIKRSYLVAQESINNANNIAKGLGKSCYVIIVY